MYILSVIKKLIKEKEGKIMKKILLGLVAILVVLAIATTNVNAASLNISAGEIEKGKEVTVTLKLDNPVENVDATLHSSMQQLSILKDNGEVFVECMPSSLSFPSS